MGNCQAAEAATVVIHNPAENKIERIYWSVSASEVMGSHPGHYVAMVVTSPTLRNDDGSPLKHLKLLRPDDTLLIGHFYRLVSFEEVLKEFAAKKCVKLGKLLREGGGFELKNKNIKKEKKKTGESGRPNPDPNPEQESENRGSATMLPDQDKRVTGEERKNGGGAIEITTVGAGGYPRRYHGGGRGGQWKPALQSISETGTS